MNNPISAHEAARRKFVTAFLREHSRKGMEKRASLAYHAGLMRDANQLWRRQHHKNPLIETLLAGAATGAGFAGGLKAAGAMLHSHHERRESAAEEQAEHRRNPDRIRNARGFINSIRNSDMRDYALAYLDYTTSNSSRVAPHPGDFGLGHSSGHREALSQIRDRINGIVNFNRNPIMNEMVQVALPGRGPQLAKYEGIAKKTSGLLGFGAKTWVRLNMDGEQVVMPAQAVRPLANPAPDPRCVFCWLGKEHNQKQHRSSVAATEAVTRLDQAERRRR